MKKALLVLGTAIIISFYPALVNAQSVIINEFSNGNASDNDWYELVVTADHQDIQGIFIESSSASNLTDYTGIQLSTSNSDFADAMRGDIILIYKIGATTGDTRVKSLWPTDITTFSAGPGWVIVVGYNTNTGQDNDATIFENGTGATKDPWPTITSSAAGLNCGLFASDGTTGIFGISYGTSIDNSTSFTLGHLDLGRVNSGMSAHFTAATSPASAGNWAIPVSDAVSTPGYLNGSTNNTLPVELNSFSASVSNGSTVNLTWTTATEVNNYGFDVERSSGNSGWQKIGFVAG